MPPRKKPVSKALAVSMPHTDTWPAPITDLEPDLPRAGIPKPRKARRPPSPNARRKSGKLNERQMAIRDLMIRYRNALNGQQIADIVGCSASQVWADRHRIRKIKPVAEDQFIAEDEIRDALGFYDDLEERLQAELTANEAQAAEHGSSPAAVGFLNVRLGLYNQLAACRQARQRFVFDIGLLREAPKRMLVEGERKVADVPGDEVYQELEATEYRIEELRRGIPESARIGAGAPAAESVPAEAEGDDQLQGPGPEPAG